MPLNVAHTYKYVFIYATYTYKEKYFYIKSTTSNKRWNEIKYFFEQKIKLLNIEML